MFLDYALSFWYGAKLIDDGTINSTMDRVYTQGDIFVVFFAIMIGNLIDLIIFIDWLEFVLTY